MIKSARQSKIRQLVEDRGQVSVNELNTLLTVSEATIRRDLEELAQMGWIRRAHGGALKVERAKKEPSILMRQRARSAVKERIGQMAASLVIEGQTIFLGSGSTVEAITPHIRHIPDLTVITNSVPVINHLVGYSNVDLIVIGGMLRQSELSMVGHIAEMAVCEFRADLVFMGMRAIDAEHGFTNDFMPEAMTDRAIIKIAPRCVVVADHTKFGRVSTVFLAPITAVHTIISDKALNPAIVTELQEKGLTVQLA